MKACMCLCVSLLAVLVAMPALAAPLDNDGDGYELYNDIGYYKLHSEKVPWHQAWDICNFENAHLVIVNSNSEAAVLRDIFRKVPVPSGEGATWDFLSAGFHDLYMGQRFTTIFGLPLATTGYYNWRDGQPDDCCGGEHCGSIDREGELNDLLCTQPLPFVCERELNLDDYMDNFKGFGQYERYDSDESDSDDSKSKEFTITGSGKLT